VLIHKFINGIRGILYCADRHMEEGTHEEGLLEITKRTKELLKMVRPSEIPTDEFPPLQPSDFLNPVHKNVMGELDTQEKIKKSKVTHAVATAVSWPQRVCRIVTDPRTSASMVLETHLKPLFQELTTYSVPTKLRYLQELQNALKVLQNSNAIWHPGLDSLSTLQRLIGATIREVPIDQIFKVHTLT